MTKEKIETKKIPNIDSIIEKAQAHYAKNEKGLAKNIASGSTFTKSTEDKDYVLWPTGNYWQKLTGIKGLKFGNIHQVSGLPNGGKSSTANVFMASAQKSGYYTILWDAEQKFQPTRYDSYMGGDSSKLLLVRTNSIQEGTKAVAYLVNAIKEEDKNGKILIVFDSVGSALPANETNEDDENMSKQPMQQAKEINWSIKKFNRLINQFQDKESGDHSIAVLVINQVYSQLNAPGYKEKGGDGLYYLSSLILQMTRKKDLIKVKKGEKIKYGIVSRVRSKKNHLFDGSECLNEIEVVVNASGIYLVDEVKGQETDVQGWDDKDEDNND